MRLGRGQWVGLGWGIKCMCAWAYVCMFVHVRVYISARVCVGTLKYDNEFHTNVTNIYFISTATRRANLTSPLSVPHVTDATCE